MSIEIVPDIYYYQFVNLLCIVLRIVNKTL